MEFKRYGNHEDLYQIWDQEEGGIFKVIMEGYYKGRHFVLGAHHSGHPNAYVKVEKADKIYQESLEYEHFDGGLDYVHGGSSYFGNAYWDDNDKEIYVGWDYSHRGDYDLMCPTMGGTKYKITDIMMDVATAICEIEMMNDDDPDYYTRKYRVGK